MLPLQLHQALSSKRSVLFSLRQCGNSVFAQCLMKPECLEISCFFPSCSLNFSNLGLHVAMNPGQKKEGLPCHIATAKPPKTLPPGPCSCFSLWSTAPQGNTCPRHISAYSYLFVDSFIHFMLLFLL